MARLEMTVRRFFTTEGSEINVAPSLCFVIDDSPEALEEFKTKIPDMLFNMRTLADDMIQKCTDFKTVRDMTTAEVTAFREEERQEELAQPIGPDDGDELG